MSKIEKEKLSRKQIKPSDSIKYTLADERRYSKFATMKPPLDLAPPISPHFVDNPATAHLNNSMKNSIENPFG